MHFFSLGDGLEYPVHNLHQPTYQSMENTQNRLDNEIV